MELNGADAAMVNELLKMIAELIILRTGDKEAAAIVLEHLIKR